MTTIAKTPKTNWQGLNIAQAAGLFKITFEEHDPAVLPNMAVFQRLQQASSLIKPIALKLVRNSETASIYAFNENDGVIYATIQAEDGETVFSTKTPKKRNCDYKYSYDKYKDRAGISRSITAQPEFFQEIDKWAAVAGVKRSLFIKMALAEKIERMKNETNWPHLHRHRAADNGADAI